MVPMWMFPIAIACGNAFVLKPSERDPGASLLLAELMAQAGLPGGVFSVVQGDKEAVDALLDHPDVAAVSFVGLDADRPPRVRDGGRSPASGCRPSAAPRTTWSSCPTPTSTPAADAAVSAGYGSAGERCMAISVVVAVDPIGDDLVTRIAERIPGVVVAPGTTPGAEMGPLVTDAHRERVAGLRRHRRRRRGRRSWSTAAASSSTATRAASSSAPRCSTTCSPEMAIYRDEIFGPVLSVVRAESYEEAVRLVDDNPYGNGVSALHPRRRGRPAVPDRGRGGHGRRQRADPRADGVLLVRRVGGLAVRRHPRLRPRGRALLHPGQGRHDPLGRPRRPAGPTSASPPTPDRRGRSAARCPGGPISSCTARSRPADPRPRRRRCLALDRVADGSISI